jgi:tRNA (guanine9-N1)-methyltransferase
MADGTMNAVTDVTVEAVEEKLSKNALKRKLRAEKLALNKGEKRAAEKLRKTQRKLEMIKILPNPQLPEKPKLTPAELKEIKARELQQFIDYAKTNFSVIIDCAFHSTHNEKTLKSLCQQIMICYGINRRSPCPVTIHITGMNEKQTQNLDKKGCSNWNNFLCHHKEYIELTDLFSVDGSSNTKEIVYLSAEAEETLETLSPNCVYVIGGVVDRNSFKGTGSFNRNKTNNDKLCSYYASI